MLDSQNIGPYSRPHRLRKLDGRTKEARHLSAVRADLTHHVGGHPSATQRILIERAATLSLNIAMMDARFETGHMTDHDSRTYLAWSNSLTRTLRELGMVSAAERPRSLADVLASGRAAA